MASSYGGKLQRFERQIHHYGSGLNALPLLSHFRDNLQDTYLLHVGYGGMNGPLSNIGIDGFASASFHSWPDTLAWDGYSGDYGPNFLGLALGSAVYLVEDMKLGLVAYGGNLNRISGSTAVVATRDAAKHRIFIGPISVYITIDAGAIEEFEYDTEQRTVSLTIATKSSSAPATAAEAEAVVIWIDDLSGSGDYELVGEYTHERGGMKVSFGKQSEVTVVVMPG